jgi:hypothetical protein
VQALDRVGAEHDLALRRDPVEPARVLEVIEAGVEADEQIALEIERRIDAAGAPGVEGVRDLAELAGDQAALAHAAHAQREVRLAPRQLDRPVLGRDLDRDPRVARADRGQHGHDEVVGELDAGRDPDHAAQIAAGIGLALDREDLLLDALGERAQVPGGGGRLVAARRAIEQAHAERRLERRDPARHRRVLDAERARRLGQAAGAMGLEEEAQIFPVGHPGSRLRRHPPEYHAIGSPVIASVSRTSAKRSASAASAARCTRDASSTPPGAGRARVAHASAATITR